METMVLRDISVLPSKKALEHGLGQTYPIYEEFINTITDKIFDLTIEWRYYNDGKAWLCKAQYKKKTVCWISVWDKYFRITFYFTDKNSVGIADLDINEEIKKTFSTNKHIGKLIPLVIKVTQKKQLKDILKIIEYKKELK